ITYDDFTIKKSHNEKGTTLISPDLATCADCISELNDSADPRFSYPFINCTNCGPRYSIIKNIPYDRPFTSMKDFKMCDFCKDEYTNPLNRRFHAQPVACKECGPDLYLLDEHLNNIECDPIPKTIELLKQGKIIGVKGIGGFHIAVDADNIQAIKELRKRKNRPEKPFAIMCKPKHISEIAEASEDEIVLLSSPIAPIVILKKRMIFPEIAPNNPTIGIFFPYAPLHHLLMQNDFNYLLMTSANQHNSPIASSEKDIKGLCDYFLCHNREIVHRNDDSVILPSIKSIIIRRSRGFVPLPISLPFDTIPSLGTGAELKLTFTLAEKKRAFLSPYIGNNSSKSTFDFYQETLETYKKWFGIIPQAVFSDLQPDFTTTKFAEKLGIPHIKIQHHHAHIAAIMADNMINEPVIGLALDGTGFGDDENIWGGEILHCDYSSYKRLFHLENMPLPGGDISIKHPLRLAWSWIKSAGIQTDIIPTLDSNVKKIIDSQLKSGFRVFQTSSAGRFFDCVSSILGLNKSITFEAQAAIRLEHFCNSIDERNFYNHYIDNEILLVKPILKQIVDDIENRINKHLIAEKFHQSLINMFVAATIKSRVETGV
ncbi:MAG: carbamoyltransferase HypF, partial [Candidatus Cloacimonadota bacterium]|nr:carbamoyltransferase HypF [Candidatus Cloacimonadota bacterium]